MNSSKVDAESEEKEVRLAPRQNPPVPADIYDELLDRYERVLVFAGQLQEKNRQQLLLQERNKDLEGEVDMLKRQVALEESYARLLENALRAVGILKE